MFKMLYIFFIFDDCLNCLQDYDFQKMKEKSY